MTVGGARMTVNVAAWPGGFARELCVFIMREFCADSGGLGGEFTAWGGTGSNGPAGVMLALSPVGLALCCGCALRNLPGMVRGKSGVGMVGRAAAAGRGVAVLASCPVGT